MTFLETTTLAYIMSIISNIYPCYILIYTFNSPTTFVFLFNTKFLDNIGILRRSSLSGCLIAFHTSLTWIAWSQWGSVKLIQNEAGQLPQPASGCFNCRHMQDTPMQHPCLDFFIRWKCASNFQNCRIASKIGKGLAWFWFSFPFGTHHDLIRAEV